MEIWLIFIHTNKSCQESPGIKEHSRKLQHRSKAHKHKTLKLPRTSEFTVKINSKPHNMIIFHKILNWIKWHKSSERFNLCLKSPNAWLIMYHPLKCIHTSLHVHGCTHTYSNEHTHMYTHTDTHVPIMIMLHIKKNTHTWTHTQTHKHTQSCFSKV